MTANHKIIEHLRKDDVLYQAIVAMNTEIRSELSIDIYYALLSSIVSQQLSTKVAKIIWNRFTGLFVDGYPDAESGPARM